MRLGSAALALQCVLLLGGKELLRGVLRVCTCSRLGVDTAHLPGMWLGCVAMDGVGWGEY